jgi:hypothetical protein
LGLGDWRGNQIKATHQPIANRTENVSLMMGSITRWKFLYGFAFLNWAWAKVGRYQLWVNKQSFKR